MQCFGGSCSLHDNLKSPPLLGRKEKKTDYSYSSCSCMFYWFKDLLWTLQQINQTFWLRLWKLNSCELWVFLRQQLFFSYWIVVKVLRCGDKFPDISFYCIIQYVKKCSVTDITADVMDIMVCEFDTGNAVTELLKPKQLTLVMKPLVS